MPPELERICSASECVTTISDLTRWPGTATYVLWNRRTGEPVYCGTAKNRGSLTRHLAKDDLSKGPVGHTMKNMPLRKYCLSQGSGWLGVSWTFSETEADAKALECSFIATYGIRRQGGQLFNQLLSG